MCIRDSPKTYYSREKCLDILYKKEIGAILAYFGLNLVVMATPFAPLKIKITYVNSPTPKTYHSCGKISRYLVSCTEVKSLAILAYFGLNLVAMATPFPP